MKIYRIQTPDLVLLESCDVRSQEHKNTERSNRESKLRNVWKQTKYEAIPELHTYTKANKRLVRNALNTFKHTCFIVSELRRLNYTFKLPSSSGIRRSAALWRSHFEFDSLPHYLVFTSPVLCPPPTSAMRSI